MQKKKSSLPIIHASLATLLLSLAIPALAHEGLANTLPRDGVTIQAQTAPFLLMVSQAVNRSIATS